MKVRVHCFVSGKVQGVSFRSYIYKVAERMKLTGWVKNLPDERVEIIAEGEEVDIEKFLELARKGPLLSEVRYVEVKKEKYTGELSVFHILL
jgi:acylphosphatase